MTRIATMGTSSCATISIAGFKDNHKAMNEAYLKDKTVPDKEGLSIQEFYNNIIVPISQPLGHTKEMPFTQLMEKLEKHTLGTKIICAVINAPQFDQGYWPEQLEKWGFKPILKSNNELGSVNHLYIRNNNAVK